MLSIQSKLVRSWEAIKSVHHIMYVEVIYFLFFDARVSCSESVGSIPFKFKDSIVAHRITRLRSNNPDVIGAHVSVLVHTAQHSHSQSGCCD